MVFRMSRPTSRQGSRQAQFKVRVPADLLHRIAGKTLTVPVGAGSASCSLSSRTKVVQFSLRTNDPAEIKVRYAVAAAHVEAFWQSLRNGPTRLTHRQVVALAGEAYREVVQTFEDDPGNPTRWEWLAGYYQNNLLRFLDGPAADSSEGTGLALIDSLLAKHGLVVDRDSVERLLREIQRALVEAAQRLKTVAEGDYREDTNVGRFPAFEKDPSGIAEATTAQTITGLLEGWWRESRATGIARSTYVNYGGAVRKLVEFLGHDDAHRVTGADIVRFKDHRLTQVSARTVKDADLAALRSVFGWAKTNLRIATNPAEGVTVRRVRAARVRDPWFTPEEVKAILGAASRVTRGQETEKVWRAKRWIPWVLAYTGARIGEIAQLRRRDLHKVDDHWEIDITPEAGTVKTGAFRRVPLHPHLVELGFPDMVLGAPDGHLFVEPNPDTGDILGPLQGVQNRVSEFVRQHVPDKGVAPNHGWRHLFVYRAREVGIDLELRNMILGHSGQTVAAREYGGPAGLYREVCKLPRFEV